MKIINVKYTSNGENNLNKQPFIIAGEHLSVRIVAEFPQTLTGTVKAYWSNTGGGSGVEECGEISFQRDINQVQFDLRDEHLNYGTLSIGFEVFDGGSEQRFEAFKINVNQFINFVKGDSSENYVVSIGIAGAERLPSDAEPYVENRGTFKDVKLFFGIPEGATPKTADKLTNPVKINGVDFDGSKSINISDDSKIPKDNINKPDGVAGLDENGKISQELLPATEIITIVNCISDFKIIPVMEGLTDKLVITSKCALGCKYYKIFADATELSDFVAITKPFVTAHKALNSEKITIVFYDAEKVCVGSFKLKRITLFDNEYGFFERTDFYE